MTSRQQVLLQPSYILHHRAYRNTSLILELFTQDFGRVSLMARGVKSPKSRLQGILQCFTPLLVSWSGRGDLPTLTTAESNSKPLHLMGGWLMSGFYINELCMRLMSPYDPYPGLYVYYDRALKAMSFVTNENNMQHQKILRLFEKKLLEELGYGLTLDQETTSGRPIQSDRVYDYIIEKGPVNRQSVNHNSALGAGIKGSSLESLDQNKLDDPTSLREAKRLMRRVLSFYLGDKPLYSRKLFYSSTASVKSEESARPT